MAKKNNLKSIRLSDQVMDYVVNFEGDGFNQKFENLVLFCMEQEETKKQRITLLDQQIAKQYKKLYALQQLSSEIGDVRRALTHLERQANDLSALMDELLEDKDEPDPDSCSKEMRYRKGGNLKRIKKKLVAVILAVNMLVIGIFGSYQTAQAAEIVAGYTAGQILESILLGFGISIFTTEMVQKGTSAAWWDTDGSATLKPYYDDLEQAYEEQRFKVINGGGGQNPELSPTPAPGNTPIPFPTTVPVPGDIPTFKELVAPALAGTAAVINMTQGQRIL